MASRIEKRGKRGTWWYLGHWHGLQYRESLKTTDKREAQRLQRFKDVEYDSASGRPRINRNVSLDAIWKCVGKGGDYSQDSGRYIAWLREHRDVDTIGIQRLYWRALVESVRGTRLSSITARDVDSVKRRRVRSGQWAERTANHFVKDIRAIFNRCINEGWYTGENPAVNVARYRITRQNPEPHSLEDMLVLLEEARQLGQDVEWVVLLGGWGGLRKLEIVNARWEWFDFDGAKPTFHVRRHAGFRIKDREERVIAMSKRIREGLQPFRKKKGFLFNPRGDSKGVSRYRFDNKKSLIRALKNAGLRDDDPFQRLRISFACMHAEAGTDIYRVSKWLGHSSVTVTERYYAAVRGYDAGIDNI